MQMSEHISRDPFPVRITYRGGFMGKISFWRLSSPTAERESRAEEVKWDKDLFTLFYANSPCVGDVLGHVLFI